MVRMAERFRQNPAILGNGLIIVGIAALAGGRLYHVIDQWQALYAADPIKIFLPPYSRSRDLRRVHHRGDRGHRAGPLPQGLVLAVGGHRRPGHLRDAGRGPPRQLLQPGAVRPADDPAVGHRDRLRAPRRRVPVRDVPGRETHFQPLFLYESLCGLIGALVLIWLASRPRPWLRVGDLAGIMFIWIGRVRFLVEFLRIGNWRIGDIPTAQLFGAAFVLIGVGILVVRRRQGAPQLVPEPGSADDVALEEAAVAEGRADRRDGGAGDAGSEDDFDDFDEFDAMRGSPTGRRSDRPGAPPEKRPRSRLRHEALAAARGGAKEGLDWLGRPPEARASLLYRLIRLVARFVLFGLFRFRIETSGQEHLPRAGGYLLIAAAHRGWMDPFVAMHAVPPSRAAGSSAADRRRSPRGGASG